MYILYISGRQDRFTLLICTFIIIQEEFDNIVDKKISLNKFETSYIVKITLYCKIKGTSRNFSIRSNFE